ncbi:MAG: MATE family efflux transporter [Acidobacteriota bacterium]
MKNPEPALEAGLARRFWRLTILNVLANVSVPLVSLVDAAMLGHLEDLRFLGGAAIAAVLFDYVFWSLNFLRMSTTGLTAQARGRGDHRQSALVLYRSLALSAAFGLLLLALSPLLRLGGFALLQVSQELYSPATDYFVARIWSAPLVLANFSLLGWFLGREESGRALTLTLVTNLANVALNAVFILGLGWAAFGAGLASSLAQVVMFGVGLFLLRQSGPLPPWRQAEVLNWSRLRKLLQLNGDIFLRTLCLTSALAAFTAFSARLGTEVLVANTLLLRLFLLAAYFIDGAAYAVETLAGLFHGARNGFQLRRVFGWGLAFGEGVALLFASLLLIFPHTVLGWLTDHQPVVELAADLAPWMLPVLVFGAAAFLLDGLFLGLTAGHVLRNATVGATLLGFAPFAVFAISQDSNTLLWAGMSFWMFARAISLAIPARGALRLQSVPNL